MNNEGRVRCLGMSVSCGWCDWMHVWSLNPEVHYGFIYVLKIVKQSDQYMCVFLTRCFVPHLIKLPVQHSKFKIQLRYHTVCYFTVFVLRVSYVRMEWSIAAFETDLFIGSRAQSQFHNNQHVI